LAERAPTNDRLACPGQAAFGDGTQRVKAFAEQLQCRKRWLEPPNEIEKTVPASTNGRFFVHPGAEFFENSLDIRMICHQDWVNLCKLRPAEGCNCVPGLLYGKTFNCRGILEKSEFFS
jgi:hypothetical protein